jgi:hypothetical protein
MASLYADEDIGSASAKDGMLSCELHPDRPALLYCLDCTMLVCSACAATKHRPHDIQDVQDVVHDRRLSLRKHAAQLDDHLRLFQANVNELDVAAKTVREQTENVEIAIMRDVTELRRRLEEDEWRLVDELSSKCDVQLKVIADAKANYEAIATELRGLHDNLDRLVTDGTDADMIVEDKRLAEIVQEYIRDGVRPEPIRICIPKFASRDGLMAATSRTYSGSWSHSS